MKNIQPSHHGPVFPTIWSNPQSTTAYLRAASENILNIIPPSCLTEPFTTFPSHFGNTHYVTNEDIVKEILLTKAQQYPKARSLTVLLEPLMPNSIFITHGDVWKKQHKTAVKTFNWRHIQGFKAPIIEQTNQFLSNYDFANNGELDITKPLQALTYAIISKILIGESEGEALEKLRHSFDRNIHNLTNVNFLDLLCIRFPWFPNTRKLRFWQMNSELKNTAHQIMRSRLMNRQPKGSNFLELMFEAYEYDEDPTNAKIDEISENLITFLVAGHETTSLLLTWALYAIAFFPEWQEKIAYEAEKPLDDMPFTESFLNETLRVYPPAGLLLRQTDRDVRYGALNMKKGEGIIIPTIAIQRRPADWQNPDRFTPERFLGFTASPYRFLPFGAGPRICIGKSLAMMEAKLIFSHFLSRYRVAPTAHIPKAVHLLTLRSTNGMYLKMTKR